MPERPDDSPGRLNSPGGYTADNGRPMLVLDAAFMDIPAAASLNNRAFRILMASYCYAAKQGGPFIPHEAMEEWLERYPPGADDPDDG